MSSTINYTIARSCFRLRTTSCYVRYGARGCSLLRLAHLLRASVIGSASKLFPFQRCQLVQLAIRDRSPARPALSHLKCKVRGRALSSRKERRGQTERREKKTKRNAGKKGRKKRLLRSEISGGDRAARCGDERWLYKTRRRRRRKGGGGGGGDGREGGGMQQSYLTV